LIQRPPIKYPIIKNITKIATRWNNLNDLGPFGGSTGTFQLRF
jgi:hypothetical protein